MSLLKDLATHIEAGLLTQIKGNEAAGLPAPTVGSIVEDLTAPPPGGSNLVQEVSTVLSGFGDFLLTRVNSKLQIPGITKEQSDALELKAEDLVKEYLVDVFFAHKPAV